MEITEELINDLTWLNRDELLKKYNITRRTFEKLLKNNNINRPSYNEIAKHNTEKKYALLLKSFDVDTFVEYYKTHSRKDTINYFHIDYGLFFFIIKKYDLHKTKEEIQSVKKNTLLSTFGSIQQYKKVMTSKQKNSTLKKYGVEYYVRSQDFKNNINSYRKKAINTCQCKYGCDNPFQLKNWNHNEASEKAFNTKKKNGTTNTSSIQEWFINELKKIYGEEDVKSEYKEFRYPFHCDAYVKSIDMFFELNIFFTHGFHPYDKNNLEDQKVLAQWTKKSEKSKFFKNAIQVWTESDPKKRECACNNNLNYIVFYKSQEVIDYIRSLKENTEC